MAPRQYSYVALLLITTACFPGMSPEAQADLKTEIAKIVSIDMPMVNATQHLAHAGFVCSDNNVTYENIGPGPNISCTRERQSFLPYACIQRVHLLLDADRTKIVKYSAEIGCYGL